MLLGSSVTPPVWTLQRQYRCVTYISKGSQAPDSKDFFLDDVIGANLSLMESMMRQGIDCSGMVKHARFLVEKSKVYQSQALLGYDLEMRERAEVFGPSVFCYGDHELCHRWLGVDALCPVTSSTAGSSSKKSVKQIRKFSGFCWFWNEGKPCKSTPCKYKHSCQSCQGNHKSMDCSSKSITAVGKSSQSK